MGWLMPFKSLRHRYRSVLEPLLQRIPVHTLVDGVSVWRGILMIPNPVERHDGRVKFAHEILPDIVDAMLVMEFVHFRYTILGGLNFRRNSNIVVLPDVM